MIAAIAQSEPGAHFYDWDGQPHHFIVGANGKERRTTLRDAREHGWLPSTTGITKLWPSDALRNWKRSQDILAAATTPRNGESDDEWIAKVMQAADEVAEKARTIGSRRHDLLHQFHKEHQINTLSEDYPFLEPYLDWLQKHVSKIERAEYITIHKDMGYGGTIDMRCILQDGRTALLDVKNRKKAVTYPEDAMQLVAYAQAERSQGNGVDAVLSVVLGTEKPEIFVQDWSLMANEAWDNFQLCYKLWIKSKNYNPALPF